jgi:hypothetical protein
MSATGVTMKLILFFMATFTAFFSYQLIKRSQQPEMAQTSQLAMANVVEQEEEPVAKAQEKVEKAKSPILVATKPLVSSKKRMVAKETKQKLNTTQDTVTVKEAATSKNQSVKKVMNKDKKEDSDFNGQLMGGIGAGKPKNDFTGQVLLGFSTDMRRFEDKDKAASTLAQITLRYQGDAKNRFTLMTGGEKGLTQGREERLQNARFSYTRVGAGKWGKLIYNQTFTGVYPLNKDAKVRDEMLGAFEISPTFIYPADKLTLVYIPRVTRNFHKFETSRANTVNTEYSFMQIFVMSYQLSDKWSLSPTLLYIDSWSYQGTQRDDGYLSLLEANYQWDRTTTLVMGLMNGGSVVANQVGQDQTIELYDENTSTVYGNIIMTF